jgi:hypothetical protein
VSYVFVCVGWARGVPACGGWPLPRAAGCPAAAATARKACGTLAPALRCPPSPPFWALHVPL